MDDSKEKITNTDQEKANTLADFFTSVFTIESDRELPDLDIKDVTKLDTLNIDGKMVRKKLESLKIVKSPRPDGLSPRILKELACVLAEPLTIISNNSVKTATLPNMWRNANITAIFKKEDRKNVGNYRSVSLTCIVCEMLESIIREQIIKHMNNQNLFCDKQYAFISVRSTVLQLLVVLDKWTEILDSGGSVDVIYMYCDF